MDALLRQLIQASEVASIRVGDREGVVRDRLGAPDDVSLTRPRILKYGDVEFAVVDTKVMQIGIYWRGHPARVPEPSVAPGAWEQALSDPATIEDVANLQLERVDALSTDGVLTFRHRADVTLIFRDGRLWSAHVE